MSDKISITLAALERHKHIIGDIEHGIKLFERGGVEFTWDANYGYIVDVPVKGKRHRVIINFSHDGKNIKSFFCNTCALRSPDAICRHVVAGILAIQGGFGQGEFDVGILSVRNNPEYLDRAVDYFSARWPVPKAVYKDCISSSMNTKSPLPRWYLLIDDSREIVGSYGLVANDFNSRQDLWPWLCALYVEESFRGRAYGEKMLTHGMREARRLGFGKLFLCTDHIGYYEKYGWKYIGSAYDTGGRPGRIYEIGTE